MPVNEADVRRAIGEVLQSEVNAYIDPVILAALNARRPWIFSIEPFVLLGPANWTTDVTNYYNRFFAGVIGAGHLAAVLQGCHGFTTPLGHNQRRLFVPYTSDFGTLIHEFIHWLQHVNAYPNFYVNDADGSFFLEGVTEYFTRRVYNGNDRLGHYDVQRGAVVFAVRSEAVTVDELAGFSFLGAPLPAALRLFLPGRCNKFEIFVPSSWSGYGKELQGSDAMKWIETRHGRRAYEGIKNRYAIMHRDGLMVAVQVQDPAVLEKLIVDLGMRRSLKIRPVP